MFGSTKQKRTRARTKRENTGATVSRSAGLAAPEEFMVDGLRVVLIKKQVKNINLRVKAPDGHVQVSAPLWVGTATVEAFVREKMSWIRATQQRLRGSKHGGMKDMNAQELEEAKACIAVCAEPLVREWEIIMGVTTHSLVYRNMTSRWGSCNPATGRICLNVQLVNYPPTCLEYVVVHELCHMLERGHGARFKALMDTFMPDWKERRALLRR